MTVYHYIPLYIPQAEHGNYIFIRGLGNLINGELENAQGQALQEDEDQGHEPHELPASILS